jgi:mannose-6-phosphate isomerase
MRIKTLDNLEKIEKPWGYEVIFARSDGDEGYVGKLLFIDAGERLSMQYHEEKEETILVKSGTLYLQTRGSAKNTAANGGIMKRPVTEIKLEPGSVYHVAPYDTHRFVAKEENVELIEVSTCQLTDIVRLSDDYGRMEGDFDDPDDTWDDEF